MRIADDGRIILTNNPGIQFGADNVDPSPGGTITAITSQSWMTTRKGLGPSASPGVKNQTFRPRGSYTKIGRQVTASFKIQLALARKLTTLNTFLMGYLLLSQTVLIAEHRGGVLTFHSVMRPNESIHLYPNRNTSRFSVTKAAHLFPEMLIILT